MVQLNGKRDKHIINILLLRAFKKVYFHCIFLNTSATFCVLQFGIQFFCLNLIAITEKT